MRTLLFAVLLMNMLATRAAAHTYVYVSLAPEKAINIYRLNGNDGSLETVDKMSVDGSPGSTFVGASKKLLFASLRTTSKLASFQIEPSTGKLHLVSEVSLPKGENAAFVATDPTERWLLSASYMAGKVVVHRVETGGKIASPAEMTVATAKTAHAVEFDPSASMVFIPHVEPNAIYQFRFRSQQALLVEAGKAEGGSPNAGPRHLRFHPTHPFAYSSDETGNSITAYGFALGKGLTPVQTVSTLPADFKGKNTTAEVRVHPNGKFAWVSNRGHDSLAGFAIDTKSGKAKFLGTTPTEKTPRSFTIDPSGRFLLSAGEGSGKLAIYRIDQDTGALHRAHTLAIGKSLTWVTAVEIGSP